MVAWKTALAILGATARAARVDIRSATSVDDDLDLDVESFADSDAAHELLSNLSSQIGFSLGRLDFENDAALDADAPVRKWPKELDSKYELVRSLACGFHGCAYLAKDKADGDELVVKVAGAGDGTQGAGEEECGRARYVQYSACGGGKAAMEAAQSYLPGCDGHGRLKNGGGYVVLPMAGGTDMNHFEKKIKKNPLSIKEQKSVFAQIVAGLYGLHKSGVSHNDMHGKNVIINDQNQVSILDYGLGTSYPCSKTRNQNGYARDTNMLYKYTAMLSDSGSKCKWPEIWIGVVADKGSYKRKMKRLMGILREKWGVDKEFEDALQEVWTGNIEKDVNQHMEGLFKTQFVQNNLPKPLTRFQLDGTAECYKWDKATLKSKMKEAGTVEFTCKK